MISCMIVDDIKSIRERFAELIDSEEDMCTVAAADCADEAVHLAIEYKPDIILMDIQLEYDKAGIDATRVIMQELPHTKVIILTVHNNDEYILDAYIAGAVDYIIKSDNAANVIRTIHMVHSNDNFLGPLLASKLKESLITARNREESMLFFVNNYSRLTDAERKTIKYLYNGKKRREIAEIEFVSEETVKTHVSHILKKLGFHSTHELIKFLKKIKLFDEFDI